MSATASVFAAVLALQAGAADPSPIVYDFEDGTTGRISLPAVPGWTWAADETRPHAGRHAARLSADGLPGDAGAAGAVVAAGPYVGKALRLTAWVRTEGAPTNLAGLWLRIDGAAGRPVFLDNMYDRPVSPGEWTRVEAVTIVPEGASRIVFGPIKSGPGSLWVDDLVLEIPERSSDPVSPETTAYLDEALGLLRTHHINREGFDWTGLEDAAHRLASGARTPAETHGAIRTVIRHLGERHTFLRPAAQARALAAAPTLSPNATPTASAQLEAQVPTGHMASSGVGVLVLPGLSTIGFQPEREEAYRAGLAGLIDSLRERGACGWIVDLRNDTGGNMWPMINGLETLLGGGPFGAFGQTTGPDNHWIRTRERIRANASGAPPFTGPPGVLSAAPVAVLLGPSTASAGEMTAIAFRGRPDTRFFGAPTAGLTTANSSFPLPDRSWLVITTSRAHDGAGTLIEGPLIPDEATAPAETLGAAVAWLRREGCRPVAP
ncbi:S41 family peptidase [Brevundimonas staleyi]|uniref:S41 family peptidase n=1 Tax=Brevundimonas staleyi TaxID=74326 RepID=A0ABW0FUZ2_9CAUL